MRFPSRHSSVSCEPDMTPMIDMVFNLIAFFMIVLNFSEGEQNESIVLPTSQLAKPQDGPAERSITLQMTSRRTVYHGGAEHSAADVPTILFNERDIFDKKEIPLEDVPVIIRGDQSAKAGWVQELIADAQQAGFSKFVLRAKSEQPEIER